MTEQEQILKLKNDLTSNAENIIEHLQKQDRSINCKLVEWNSASNNENGILGMYYIPLCTKRQEVILNSDCCKKCEFKDKKFEGLD